MCKVSQFSCALTGPCISLAEVCNGVGDCPNGEDEASCGKEPSNELTMAQTETGS